MSVPIRYILAAIAFAIAILGFVLLPTGAHADCGACQPPPPCHCEPPPSCSNACSHSESHAEAHASAFSVNVARAQTPDVVLRNRGGGVDVSVSAGVESSLFLTSAAELTADGATASLRAVCVDAQGAERMAAQTFADPNVPEGFRGELYRCASGMHMRAATRSAGLECATGQALWYESGELTCRAQIAHARGYEQALISRYGYADKVAAFVVPGEANAAFAESAAPGGVGGF